MAQQLYVSKVSHFSPIELGDMRTRDCKPYLGLKCTHKIYLLTLQYSIPTR